ncbi:hypothetical protein IU433_28560 [Nocardia puris]|uniref:Excreted virulence factor EspC (Type VII ESX diderm) n=1 Tax=Nocardia puris TaxID=208602 RepID=A0A366D2Y8_9NOCA|nr:hypothetical protein [Nocardia puris]MBF6213834.1 hypothetical protein [Nocardia puris]MBF6368473.1 hypothetical protein [Nocardia puris]MBF6462960.1 hypothetical protein [Nocardia puris]RBO84296.1 hypothetical protein DFR74_117117 [Nocardia puris]
MEEFWARPSEIAGLSKLVDDLGNDSATIATFIGENCHPEGELFTGVIISDLLTPFNGLANTFKVRMSDIGTHNKSTAVELNKTAWMYHDQDQRNYAALNAHTSDVPGATPGDPGPNVERQGQTAPYGAATQYPKPESITLNPPTVNQEDTAGLIGEVAPWLNDVNESIKSVTRMAGNEVDPLVWVLKPIEGNWNEVRRIGESYKVAGNAMEATGKNLENGVKLVGEHWNGKAAISFEQNWAQRQIAAMKWEGPVGRVLADVAGKLADEIRAGIKTALTKLKEMLEDYIDVKSVKGIFKNVIKRVPGLGQIVEVVDLGHKIYTIVTAVKDIVDKIEETKNRLKEFLEFLNNPTQVVAQKLEEKVQPALRTAAVANDLKEISKVNSTLERPRESYEVGTGNQPWENG